MKFLHIFSIAAFTEQYIEFINSNFDSSEHRFVLYGDSEKFKITPNNNVSVLNMDIGSMLIIIRLMYGAEKVILHGLFSGKITALLFFQPWLLKKCNWVIWGGDLYRYKFHKKGVISELYELVRKVVIRNMSGLITHIKGDYELAKEWYGAKGKYYYSFMYPSNLYKDYDITKIEKADNDKIYIQVGNSADPSNNHIEILHKLVPYKDANIEILCPLSYGNVENKDKVINEGVRIFGNKFKPLTEYLPFDSYIKLLAMVDVAIFNHKRQQGMGNITTLLGLGKKVYIRDDITTWNFCLDHGLKVYSSNNGFNDLLIDIDEINRQKNINIIKGCFSKDKLIADWNEIFK